MNDIHCMLQELNTSLHLAYQDLCTIAVFLEDAIKNEQKLQQIDNILNNITYIFENHIIKGILCHLYNTVLLLGGPVSRSVNRDILPSVDPNDRMLIHYAILNDLKTLLNHLIARFEKLKKQDPPSHI